MTTVASRSSIERPDAGLGPVYATQKTLLVVDDDEEILSLTSEPLARAGYHVKTASDGPSMFAILNSSTVDLIVLDLNLAGEDGISLCRRCRSQRNVPVIMLTARRELIDRIIGLEVGADDYITKPFDPRELVARVHSVMRRVYVPQEPQEPAPPKRASFEGWTLDFRRRRLTDPKGRVVMLSGNDYSLLKFLIEHANQVLTREQLLTLAPDDALTEVSSQRAADLQISRLRRKLDDDGGASKLIVTVRGQGYVLAAAVILHR